MPQTTRLVLNGKGAANPAVRVAINGLRRAGNTIEVRTTWESGDAARLAVEAMSDRVDRLVAGGGDGTINEIVNGLLGASERPDVALGILPLGTANDFARGCGIPLEPRDALALAIEGTPVAVDAGKANDQYFMNVASGGFGAEVTTSTPPDLKRVMGGGAYALVGILTALKLEPYQGRMKGPDGDEDHAALVMAVGNGRQAGGGFQVTPNALLNDGLLDVMIVRDFPGAALGQVLDELQKMDRADNEFVYYRQLPVVEIEADREAPVNLDGEPQRWNNMRFECLPGVLSLVLPDDCPMLAN